VLSNLAIHIPTGGNYHNPLILKNIFKGGILSKEEKNVKTIDKNPLFPPDSALTILFPWIKKILRIC